MLLAFLSPRFFRAPLDFHPRIYPGMCLLLIELLQRANCFLRLVNSEEVLLALRELCLLFRKGFCCLIQLNGVK